ncbi:MAG: sigma-54 dependent transcriptional regulator [Acidobacteriota bacterium]|nr:sigma-54 dependent transcriptional regulator [Acidobacteriota bacterium]
MDVKPHLLVVDDEANLLDFLTLLFEQEDYRVTATGSLSDAREALGSQEFDLVLCDIMMPDGSGMELLKELGEHENRTSVIMMTAYSSTKIAIEAMKLGAYDYVSKPFDVEELKLLVQKALEKTELVDENVYLRRELEQKYAFGNIVGRSPRMSQIFDLIERVSKTASTVLVHGESGTGKELVARAIHFASPRSTSRFMSVNCGAMPENLLESELFGHEKGAFTGAVKEKRGLFQEADNGTLFLDEISEMSPPMQVKLLRVLQEKVIRKVGGTREESVDSRIIAATNRNLLEMIEEGTFREDLYYRINVIPIQLPPLRQRREDIPLLVDHFIGKCCEQMALEPKRISMQAMRQLEAYDWPGNVRELENLMERTLALSSGKVIDGHDLPRQVRTGSESGDQAISLPREGVDLEGLLDEIRRDLMVQALERTNWVQTQAAELLRMSFRSFRYYGKKVGVTGRKNGEEEFEVDAEIAETTF